MPSPANAAGTPTGEENGEIVRVMEVAVPHPAAVQDQHVVEQRAVAVRRRLQLLEVVRELLRVVRVDLRLLRQELGIVAMVRDGMVRLGGIGRAACRGRVEISVGAGSIKKKKK